MGLIYGINPVHEAIVSGKTINKLYGSKGSKEVYELLKLAKSMDFGDCFQLLLLCYILIRYVKNKQKSINY